jgi:predicted amidohydrolase YtcJ
MQRKTEDRRGGGPGAAPERILLGRVLDFDGSVAGGRAQAGGIAIAGERIVACGSRAEMLAAATPATVINDLRDAVIMPGFNDVHAHLDTEGLQHVHHSLAGARSIAEVQARIAAIAATLPIGEWIVMMPVGEPPFYFGGPDTLAERRMPDRHELDAAAPDHPVCILAPSGYWSLPPCHTALNSLGLQRNGIDRHSVPRLAGLEIAHDASGEPNGILIETNLPEAMQLDLLPAVPRFTRDQRKQAIRRAIQAYHAMGTTSVFEGHGCAPELISIYREMWERDELSMRMGLVVSPVWRDLDDARRIMRDWLPHASGSGFGDAMLRIAGVFIAYGGDIAAAAMQQHHHAGDLGFWNNVRQANAPSDFEELCLIAARNNLRVHTIAIHQLDELVPVFERIDRQFPLAGRRWTLEHMSVTRRADLARLRDFGMGVTLIPDFHLWKVGHQRFLDLDDEAASLVSPVRALRELGVPVGAGTDASPYDPMATVRAMVLRRERISGKTIGEGGRLSVPEALHVMTAGGAWFTGDEHQKGRLRPGYLADCVVLGQDPTTTDPERLESIERLATIVGGRLVHGDW